jgi:hypothetical protein
VRKVFEERGVRTCHRKSPRCNEIHRRAVNWDDGTSTVELMRRLLVLDYEVESANESEEV